MATYRNTLTGETAVTVNGSYNDRRKAADDGWEQIDTAGTASLPPEPPAKSASKEEWVTYATHPDVGVPSYEADNLTKQELIARVTDSGQES